MKKVLLLLMVAALATVSQADTIVIGDFEDGTAQGWFQNGSRPITVVADPSGKSSFVLAVDWGGANGFDWTLGLTNNENPALLLLDDGPVQRVEFDIIWDADNDWTGDGWMQWTQIAYNYDGGWTQVNVPTSPGGSSDRDWGTFDGYGEQHPEWDFIANGTPLSGGSGWAQLYISTNSGNNDDLNPITQGTFYIDNITIHVIPEPCSLALLGLGGLLLRRKK